MDIATFSLTPMFPVLWGNLGAFAVLWQATQCINLYYPIVLHLHLTVSHCIKYLVSLWRHSGCSILVSGILLIVPRQPTSPQRSTFVLWSWPDRSPADWPMVLNQLRLETAMESKPMFGLGRTVFNLVLYKMCTIEFKWRKALNCLQLKTGSSFPVFYLCGFSQQPAAVASSHPLIRPFCT